MPPVPIIDLASVDLSRTVVTRDEIYEWLPQRHEFQTIDGILYLDPQRQVMVAYRDVRADEWWCLGHLPGRPILPGILMVETAAQMAAFFSQRVLNDRRFMAFGGIDEVKFRGIVTPPARLIMVGESLEVRPRRTICRVQGFVEEKMVFEGKITGLPID